MSMGSRENKQNKVRTQLWDTLYLQLSLQRWTAGLLAAGDPGQAAAGECAGDAGGQDQEDGDAARLTHGANICDIAGLTFDEI